MRRLLSRVVLVACVAMMTSCSEDEQQDMPSCITDFVVAETGADAIVKRMQLEDGSYVVCSQKVRTQKADTTYRCIATYTLEGNGKCVLYNLEHVFSAEPKTLQEFGKQMDSLRYDPVNVVSVWRSGTKKYANMQLGVLTTGNGAHGYAFCVDSVVNQVKHISLRHNRPTKDAESYTQRMFASMPLHPEVTNVSKTVLHIYTYDGWKTYEF